jgi:hypothetical protein
VDASGKVIWTYDAKHEFQTVNGVMASGGSFGSSGGPVLVGGTLYVVSGYAGIMQGTSGNVLLAFSVE